MGQQESKEDKESDEELQNIKEKLDKEGPAAASMYIEESINRWKTENVKFAVTGRSATGKSTFINKVRGVEPGEEGAAMTGSGDTTMVPTKYEHPENPNIMYYDLPGVGTLQFRKEEYVKEMKLEEYDFFFLFFDKVIGEDDLWLVEELTKLKKPYCLVRSKIDDDIRNADFDNRDKTKIIPEIREKVLKSIAENKQLQTGKHVFIISCRDTKVGEMSELLAFVERNLDRVKCEALISSLAIVSEDILKKKYDILKRRMIKVTFIAAGISAAPVPGIDVTANIILLAQEVMHYKEVYGLTEKRLSSLGDFNCQTLKCSKILLPHANISAFVISQLGVLVGIMAAENFIDVFLPFVGSIISGGTSAAIAYSFLNAILKDVFDDAVLVHQHIIAKHQSAYQ